jgi:Tol biopolymer transport system component
VASARRLIKQGALVLAACLGALAPLSRKVRAQAPDEDWRTLPTQHFRVTFPARLEPLGQRAAQVAEVAYGRLAGSFLEPPRGRIDLLVTDHTDDTNGYAQVVPSNRITVFARPPVDAPSLSYFDDWMELVITHELAHIVHLDYTRNPLGRLLRAVSGRAESGWPYFPGIATPAWVTEGLATWYESDLTSAGRVHGTFHEMVLRTATLEGRFESLAQASGESPLWPGGSRPYAYGSLFFEFLLERYGEERMTTFAEAVAGQWIPYRLNAAGRTAFGVSLSQAWREWTDSLGSRYRGWDAELARLAPVTEPERLTDGARWAFHPSVSPDGRTLVYARADGRSDLQLHRRSLTHGAESSLRTNGLATYGWTPDGRLLLSQLEQDGPYRAYADLYLVEADGSSRRLTRGERLEQPSASPDARWAVAVQNGDGSNALVRVDLTDGSVTTLVAADPRVHWAFPRISPDGRWIATARWEPGAYTDIVLLEAASGREVQRLTRDRAVDLAPSWSPDARWLVWSSDRTGVTNILGTEVDPSTGAVGPTRLLTNLRTGGTYPSVDPEGRWIYFSGYHVDGWEVERVPFAPGVAPPAPPPADRFEAPPAAATPLQVATGTVEDYAVWPTLLPRYWSLRTREAVVGPRVQYLGATVGGAELLGAGIGVETSGVDLVRRHAYAVYGLAFTSGGELDAGAAYAYRGLGNPILSISAEQRWLAGGVLVGTIRGPHYVLERERALNASATLFSARWRRSLSLTLGGGLVWESRKVLDAEARPTSELVLTRPTGRLGEARVAVGFSTARTFSFQTGGARGFSAALQARSRRDFGLDSTGVGVVGIDRTFAELTGRLRAYVPLWGGGHATHVLAMQVAGGAAYGAGAQFGHFGVGGASGTVEDLTGLELFGGSYLFLPVRGYDPSSRFGRYAWAGSAEYRFPLALINRGLGAWPLHFDRLVGSLFLDAGNAWAPTPRAGVVTSVGGELTLRLLGFWNSGLLLRTGLAAPLVGGASPHAYVRVGMPF